MKSLHQLEVIIMLLAVVLALTTIAQKIRIPYPIFLVLGGWRWVWCPVYPQ
jgi:CPA1 family monovalent cation:H+ antiporter